MVDFIRGAFFPHLRTGKFPQRRLASFRARLEELESRQAPASFAVNAQLEVSRLDDLGETPGGAHAVVFFESAVANYQVLQQSLDAGTDAVVLDKNGDGLKEMASFLVGHHDLTSIGVVAHGAPGVVAFGKATLDAGTLMRYRRELAMVGSALGNGGELDMWSCDVAAGEVGADLLQSLAKATRVRVAAASHPVGAAEVGGSWQLDVRAGAAHGEVPFALPVLHRFHQVLGTWSAAASMLEGTGQSTATVLANGKVLVSGGVAQVVASSAELYDPSTNTWSFVSSMSEARRSAAAILLTSGQVLVAGGAANGSAGLSTAELYDPVTDSWSPAGSMALERWDWTHQWATLLNNGKVLVVGNTDSIRDAATAEIYDPATNSWSAAADMAATRWHHTVTLLGNGKVLVAGGYDGNGDLSSAELYDPSNDTWTPTASLTTPRDEATATLLSNGKVLVVGGSYFHRVNTTNVTTYLASAELYDPVSNTWSPAGAMRTGRSGAAATLLSNGKVLVAGGWNGSALSSAELYDPASNTWSSTGSMAVSRLYPNPTLLTNGKVLFAGDASLTANEARAELYNPTGINIAQSTITVAPATIPSGGSATVTLTARDDSGNPITTGGLPFSFGLGAGTGSGTFSNLTDNHDGTYTAKFTGTTPGPITITATLGGQPISPTLPTITVTPVVVATQLVISNVSVSSLAAGGSVTFTVTAQDSSGTTVPNYTGTVQLTSSDSHAVSGGTGLPTSYTFVASDNGAHTFTVTLATAGSQTITATDQANNGFTVTTIPITVSTGPLSKFLVGIPGGNTLVAGTPFLFSIQAIDASGNPVTSYSGPTNVTATASPPNPQAGSSITGILNGSGFGVFVGNLKTAGTYTLTATAGTFAGTSGSLTVIPSDANYFTVTAPAAATTGNPFNVTVTPFDHFGNIATGYTGTVKLTSTDPTAATLVGRYTFTTGASKDNGVHTFNIALKTGGSQTITATEVGATNPAIIGTSSAITTRGLVVSAFTPTPTGFTATFNTPFLPANVSLWGGTVVNPIQNVTLVGAKNGPINGSLIIDPTNTSITFNASAIYLSTLFQSTVLPNDEWHVRLVSRTGDNGFMDAVGAGLDGANDGGHADYTTTFTTANEGKQALSIPDFARGPDGAHTIKVPNDSAGGIPVTLSNAAAVKDVVFTLSYNPALLTPTGGGIADAPAGSAFTMGSITSVDATHATVMFTFHNDTAQNGTVVLGDILATVPDSAANQYKGKELLGLGSITVNGAAFTGVAASGLHVNAYLGDVTGNGTITGLDVATANTVAQGNPASPIGLAAFRLVDPAIIGDIAGDASIDATAVSDLAAFTSNLKPSQMPALPTGLTIAPGGPDPTLSLAGSIQPSGIVSVPVLLDNARPKGSTGMTEAILALTYDPKALRVSSSDITLGSIPSTGSGWQLSSVIDQVTGQIGIDLYSATPSTSMQTGALVNIAFHIMPGPSVTATTVHLVSLVMLNGQQFTTQVDDAQGQLVLSPGVDQVAIETAVWPTALLTRGRRSAPNVRGRT